MGETLANAVIAARGIPPLVNALVSEPEDHIKSASAWSLGQIGRHSPEHARALADAQVLPSDTGGAKKQFVTSGCLKKIQQLRGDEKIDEYVKLINGLYPNDIVEYYSPNFHTELLKKLESV